MKFAYYIKYRGSSLLIVLVISLVLSILVMSFLMLFQYNKQQANEFLNTRMKLRVIKDIQTLINSTQLLDTKGGQNVDLYGDNSTNVRLTVEAWGAYKKIRIFSVNNDTLYYVFLLGEANDLNDSTALCLTGKIEELAVGGMVSINGNIASLNKRFSAVSIEQNKSSIDTFLKGKHNRDLYKSLTIQEKSFSDIKSIKISLDNLDSKSFQTNNNSFLNPTLSYSCLGDLEIADTLKGNIIIRSQGKIIISKKAYIEDCIIFAKSIVYQSLTGSSCQLFAEDSIVIEKNAQLLYPSVVGLLKDSINNTGTINSILIEDSSYISGEIISAGISNLINNNRYNFYTRIGNECKIQGIIYSDGVVDIHGLLYGRCYANSLTYFSSYGVQENLLHKIQITPNKMSKYFVRSEMLGYKEDIKIRPKYIIKWLN